MYVAPREETRTETDTAANKTPLYVKVKLKSKANS